MGVSKAEVNLKRLLRAQANQTNEAKLVHYVATMRSLLADLTGDPAHQGQLPTIPASRARDYAHQIDAVAQKLQSRGIQEDQPHIEDTAAAADEWEPVRVSTKGVSTSRRRRLQGDDAKSGTEGVRVAI